MVQPIPAPSLRELSSECETEGVSSVGCSMPTIYTPAIMISEIFERLRSSKYTPSVTPIGRASSLREGAGMGCVPFIRPLRNRNVAGDFHRPYESSEVGTFRHSSDDTPSVTPVGRDSSLREGAGNGCAIHPTTQKPERCGRFSSPLRNSEYLTAQKLPVSDAKAIPGGAGHPRIGTRPKRN